MSKFKKLVSPSTGQPVVKYDPAVLKTIQDKSVLNGIIRGYLADPSQISLFPIDPKDLVSDLHKNMFTVMNLISLRGLKMVDKAKIEEILKEPELDISVKNNPSALEDLKKAFFGQYDKVALNKQGCIDNLIAYYNMENKYFTLRELYKKGADISDFFIPDNATGILNEAEMREQAKENFENNSAEEMRNIILESVQESPTMLHKGKIPLLRDTELPHANDKIEWLVEKTLVAGTFNSIIGAAKAGKSQAAMELSFCLVNGLPFLGKFPVKQCEVLYVDFELNDNEIKRRYDLLRDHYGLDAKTGKSPYVFNMKDNFTKGSVDMPSILAEIKKYKRDYPEIRVVIFDCYYTFSQGDSNAEKDVWQTLQPLKALSGVDQDLTVIYVHHSNKNGVNSNNAIYASGGSGVHGKVIDTSIVIYPVVSGREHTVVKDMYNITAVGRTGGFDADTIYDRSEKNGFFFFPADEYDLKTTNSMTESEFIKKFPVTWKAFDDGNGGRKETISTTSQTYESIKEEFKKNGSDPMSVLVKLPKEKNKVHLPRFLEEIDEEQEQSNIATQQYAKDVNNAVAENKF